jgi:hypothetical protein
MASHSCWPSSIQEAGTALSKTTPSVEKGNYVPNFSVKAKENSVSGGAPLLTGISLTPGQLLTINVDPCDSWIAGKDKRTSNANGLGNPFGGNFGLFTKNGFSFLYGSLVGSLDEGKTFFPVGTRLEMTILYPGRLALYYWDSDNANNSDSVVATVAVYNGPDVSQCKIEQA